MIEGSVTFQSFILGVNKWRCFEIDQNQEKTHNKIVRLANCLYLVLHRYTNILQDVREIRILNNLFDRYFYELQNSIIHENDSGLVCIN